MTTPIANVFLLCDRNQIPSLRQIFIDPLPQGAVELTIESDGDAAQKRFSDRLPEVLVITASLAIGDARTVISDLRAQAPRQQVAIVLIGDEQASNNNSGLTDSMLTGSAGPIRTALDALDFAADKFVSRPLSSKSLRFAVGSCIESILSTRKPVPPMLESFPIADESSWREASTAQVASDTALDAQLPPLRETTFVLADNEVRDSRFSSAVPDSIAPLVNPHLPTVAVVTVEAANAPSELGNADELDLSARTDGESWQPAQVSSVSVEEPTPGVSRDFARQLRAKMARMADRLFAQPPAFITGPPSVQISDDGELDVGTVPAEPLLPMNMETEHDAKLEVPLLPPRPRTSSTPRPGPTGSGPAIPVPTQEIVFGATDAAFLLARCHQQQLTGRLLLRNDRCELVIHFEQGRAVFSSSNQPADRMGQMLCREGKISRAQLAQSDKQVGATGRRAGETLVDLGFLKRRELLPAVRRHLEELLYSAFSWRSGTYDIISDDTASTEKIRISRQVSSLVVEGVRRKFAIDEFTKIGIRSDSVMTLIDRDKCNAVLGALELQPSERAAINAATGTLTLQQLADSSGADIGSVAPVAYALATLGLTVIQRAIEDESQDDLREDTGSLFGESDAAIDRARIVARCQLIDDADYFAILGVRRDATSFEIRRAYDQGRKDFAVDSLPTELHHELAVQLEDIGSLLEEAYAVLRDEPLRRSYLAHLGSPVDVAP
jgi:DNA-binding response OmpR family regulator